MKSKRAVLVVLLLSCLAGWVAAQDLNINEHRSIAPISIPINTTGVSDIGMVRLKLRDMSGTGGCTITNLRVVPNTSYGTGFDTTWVGGIKVYLELNGATDAGEYDHGSTGGGDTLVSTGYSWNVAGYYDVTVNAVIPDGNWNYIYVVFDLTSSAPVSTDLGASVSQVTYINGAGSPRTPPGIVDLNGTRQNFDILEATVDAVWRHTDWAPGITGSVAANASKVPVLRLDFDATDAAINSTTAPVQLDKVRVHLTYGQDNWVNTAGVLLYADDGDGIYEPDAGDGAYVASATLSGGYALLDPPNAPITSAGKTYFVAVNMNGATAQVGQTFGLNIDNPSTDIIFADEISDDALADLADTELEYACLRYTAAGTWEYDQLGYITSTTADPAADIANTFTIDPADDGNPPAVSDTIPGDTDTDVSRNADITVFFNEYMKESSVEDPTNFTISGGITPTSFTYTNSAKRLDIVLPTLAWDTIYTATVKYTVQDFYGNAMGTSATDDYDWTFTTEPARHPTVLSTVPENNSTNVVRDTLVTATFSENVSGVSGSSFKLHEGSVGGTEVTTVTVTYDSVNWVATMTLDPPGTKLKYNTQYFAVLDHNSITDSDGLKLADAIIGGTEEDYQWTFLTVANIPPAVLAFTPADGATSVPIASTITVTFSKPVKASTLAGNITLEVEATGASVDGTITPASGNTSTATFTPDEPLDYLTEYRVTISTGVTDTDDSPMTAPETWTFTTFGFSKATVVNNRLGAGGGASECLIFVPQSEADDRVSVQVFTTTGRLVRTFCKNKAYSSVDVPIRWDGTNDKGKDLGPGLYFVQIVVNGVKQTLKVLIVR